MHPKNEVLAKQAIMGLVTITLFLVLWGIFPESIPPWRSGSVQSILVEDGICSVLFKFETGDHLGRTYYKKDGDGLFSACARLVQDDRIKFREWNGMDSWGVYILGKDMK